jgi:glycosyltransferase involved in cell wall biosynthesis
MPETSHASAADRALPLISVVFVTYNRVVTLRPTLASFLAMTDYPRDRLELVVTDDASPGTVQAAIREMGFDVLALSPSNRGMGANVNRGIASAQGDYVLQLQDDWRCLGPPNYLRRALAVMEAHADVGMVICRPHPRDLPVVRSVQVGDDTIRIFKNDPCRTVGMVGEHGYTDWPHLKRREFIKAIGSYKEGHRMWVTELDYARRVNAQTRYAVADIVGMDAFGHIGAELSYNSGPLAGRLASKLERFAPAGPLVQVARKLKRCLSGD